MFSLIPADGLSQTDTNYMKLLGIDKTNVGFVATSNFVEEAHLKPSDIANSVSLVNKVLNR